MEVANGDDSFFNHVVILKHGKKLIEVIDVVLHTIGDVLQALVLWVYFSLCVFTLGLHMVQCLHTQKNKEELILRQ